MPAVLARRERSEERISWRGSLNAGFDINVGWCSSVVSIAATTRHAEPDTVCICLTHYIDDLQTAAGGPRWNRVDVLEPCRTRTGRCASAVVNLQVGQGR